jgi:hypothetical protein
MVKTAAPGSAAFNAALDAVAAMEGHKIPASTPAAPGYCSAGGEDGAKAAPENRASRLPDGL